MYCSTYPFASRAHRGQTPIHYCFVFFPALLKILAAYFNTNGSYPARWGSRQYTSSWGLAEAISSTRRIAHCSRADPLTNPKPLVEAQKKPLVVCRERTVGSPRVTGAEEDCTVSKPVVEDCIVFKPAEETAIDDWCR